MPRNDATQTELRDAQTRRQQLLLDVENLYARIRAEGDDDGGLAERIGNLSRGVEHADEEIRELEDRIAREERVRAIAANPANLEAGSPPATNTRRVSNPTPRDDAMRAIERLDLSDEAGVRLESVFGRDRSGLDARYVTAVSNEHYASAFFRMVARPMTAQHELTPAESEAVRAVVAARETRAMSVGTPGEGGFAVPAALDPSILLTSDGALNPLRQLATTSAITTSEWRGITSEGVTATFSAEAAEASDDSPTLDQPSIWPERCIMFVPVSYELFGDFVGLQQELARLFSDAKDIVEGDKYVHGLGHGSNEPEGILVGATNVVQTLGVNTMAPDDFYDTQGSLGSRFQGRASWATSLTVANEVYRWSGPGSEEPPLLNEQRTLLLGKRWTECSVMSSTTNVGGEQVAIYGDIRAGFRIVDRIGLSVEIAQNLMGPNGRPTGQRGLIAWFRTSSGVVVDNALRVLQVAAS